MFDIIIFFLLILPKPEGYDCPAQRLPDTCKTDFWFASFVVIVVLLVVLIVVVVVIIVVV